MSKTPESITPKRPALLRILSLLAAAALMSAALSPATGAARAQQAAAPAPPAAEKPLPGIDLSSMDLSVDPCTDMYKFACGKFDANHPIPPDQPDVDPFYVLYNVNTQELNGILEKAEAGGAGRSPDEQKIGDYFKACMNTDAINAAGLKPIQPLLDEIDALGNGPAGRAQLAALLGKLQRDGVDVFFGYGEQQDFKDATKQIAEIDQGGLGLPEKDYYLRTGDKDVKLRQQYVAHVAKMLTLAGSTPEQAQKDAQNIMTLETALAKASLGVDDMREPEKTYHLQPIATFTAVVPGFNLGAFDDAIHSPHVTEINNSTPDFWPAMILQLETQPTWPPLRPICAITCSPQPTQPAQGSRRRELRLLRPHPQRAARTAPPLETLLLRGRRSHGRGARQGLRRPVFRRRQQGQNAPDGARHRGRNGPGHRSDRLDVPRHQSESAEKLAAVANKIGYPDKWRDYTKLEIKPDDAVGNELRANAFENDRQLNKIGKPVDKSEWEMSPPTVNAYYDDSMNNINFPAGILQPPFYDRTQDIAVNYGHIGAVIGHELTHGFDDEGRKFDAKGDLDNWWTPEDLKNFEARTDCLVNEYHSFTAVDDVKIDGKLTLGENTADNGGALLAFMAYMQRAKDDHLDLNAKVNGFTGPQRFYIAYAQNWCQNIRPEAIRSQVLTDPHSPDTFRTNGVIVNQPGFAGAFSCKKPTPMVPANSCRVW